MAVFTDQAEGDEGSNVIHVGPYGNYTSIQAAIDNASSGDTIIVDDGIYYENLTITKDLILTSSNGSAFTTIKGTGMVAISVQTVS